MEYMLTIVLATFSGLIARYICCAVITNSIPVTPQGWAIHLFIGFIGALLGAILVLTYRGRICCCILLADGRISIPGSAKH